MCADCLYVSLSYGYTLANGHDHASWYVIPVYHGQILDDAIWLICKHWSVNEVELMKFPQLQSKACAPAARQLTLHCCHNCPVVILGAR